VAQLRYYHEHREERVAYKREWNRTERHAPIRHCKYCGAEATDRRFRCRWCGLAPRSPHTPTIRAGQALAG
jgi:hypothetical protein